MPVDAQKPCAMLPRDSKRGQTSVATHRPNPAAPGGAGPGSRAGCATSALREWRNWQTRRI